MKSALYLLLAASSLLYFPLAFEEFELPKAFALITFGCFALFFICWRNLFKDQVAKSLAVFTSSAALSMVFSIDRHMSVFGNPKCACGVLVVMSYLIAYMAMTQTFKFPFEKRAAIRVILLCSSLVASYAIAQVFGIDFKKWNGTTESYGYVRPMSFLGHPNFMAAYLSMTLPFAISCIESARFKMQRIAYSSLVVISLAAIFFSQSRGMWIACSVGLLTYFIASKSNFLRFIRLGALASLVIAISIISSPSLRESASQRLENIVSPGPARLEYLKGALRVWKRYPFLGSGTDTFEFAFQNQRTSYYWQVEAGGSPHRAHNDFLNILATQGIIGAFAALFVTFTVIRRIRSSQRSEFFAPAVASIAVFYVQGLTSFTVVAIGLMFMLCLALLKENEV